MTGTGSITIQELDNLLRSNEPFNVVKQQTHSWDIAFNNDPSKILHIYFIKKIEQFKTPIARRIPNGWYLSHPALVDYHEGSYEIVLVKTKFSKLATAYNKLFRTPTKLYSKICAIIEESDAWYSSIYHLNPVEVLEDGYGMVLRGPNEIIGPVSELLTKWRLRFQIMRGPGYVKPEAQLLVLNKYCIIAKDFQVTLRSR